MGAAAPSRTAAELLLQAFSKISSNSANNPFSTPNPYSVNSVGSAIRKKSGTVVAVAVVAGEEELIGSVRRECLDHVIVLNEAHLRRILTDYFGYYNGSRPHLSLDRNAPVPREIEPPELGEVVALPCLGGLHHRYTRRAG